MRSQSACPTASAMASDTSIPLRSLTMLKFLNHHGYAAHRAFPDADAAPLAVLQVGLEIPVLRPVDARVRTIQPADAAADALILVNHWPERTPGAGLVLPGAAGLADSRPYFQVLTSYLVDRSGHVCLLLYNQFIIGPFQGPHVLLSQLGPKAVQHGPTHIIDPKQAGRLHNRAHHGGVHDDSSDLFPGDFVSVNDTDTTGEVARIHYLLIGFPRIDDEYPVRLQALDRIDQSQEPRVENDHHIGLVSLGAGEGPLVVNPAKSHDRGAPALGSETREGLSVFTLADSRYGDQLGRGDRSLPASPVHPYLQHVSSRLALCSYALLRYLFPIEIFTIISESLTGSSICAGS